MSKMDGIAVVDETSEPQSGDYVHKDKYIELLQSQLEETKSQLARAQEKLDRKIG